MSSLSIARYFPFRRVRIPGQSVAAQADLAMIGIMGTVTYFRSTFRGRPAAGFGSPAGERPRRRRMSSPRSHGRWPEVVNNPG